MLHVVSHTVRKAGCKVEGVAISRGLKREIKSVELRALAATSDIVSNSSSSSSNSSSISSSIGGKRSKRRSMQRVDVIGQVRQVVAAHAKPLFSGAGVAQNTLALLKQRIGFLEIEDAEAIADALARTLHPEIEPACLGALVKIAGHEQLVRLFTHSYSTPQVTALARKGTGGGGGGGA